MDKNAIRGTGRLQPFIHQLFHIPLLQSSLFSPIQLSWKIIRKMIIQKETTFSVWVNHCFLSVFVISGSEIPEVLIFIQFYTILLTKNGAFLGSTSCTGEFPRATDILIHRVIHRTPRCKSIFPVSDPTIRGYIIFKFKHNWVSW